METTLVYLLHSSGAKLAVLMAMLGNHLRSLHMVAGDSKPSPVTTATSDAEGMVFVTVAHLFTCAKSKHKGSNDTYMCNVCVECVHPAKHLALLKAQKLIAIACNAHEQQLCK
jgi:hypothetical protein